MTKKKNNLTQELHLRLSKQDLAAIDRIQEKLMMPSRSSAIRAALTISANEIKD